MEGVTQPLKGRCRSEFNTAFDQPTELTPPPIRMDWSFSLKDEILSLRMGHQVPHELYKYILTLSSQTPVHLMFYSTLPAGLERHFIIYEDGLNILEGAISGKKAVGRP
jgi:hypothetical protein